MHGPQRWGRGEVEVVRLRREGYQESRSDRASRCTYLNLVSNVRCQTSRDTNGARTSVVEIRGNVYNDWSELRGGRTWML